MPTNPRAILILVVVFVYILLQFLWWEILLVKQNDLIINEKQKLVELATVNEDVLKAQIEKLHHKKRTQTLMIVGEGTVFLMLLLFGIYKIKQSVDRENLLNNQQKNFFLSITHELKTPIAATKLQLQTLQKQKLGEAEQQELINHALRETDRLNTLIDNVLLAHSFERGEYRFSLEKQDLSELIHSQARRYYKKELESGKLQLNLKKEVYAALDVQAFPSVILNLLSNAFKYSDKEKSVKIELETHGQKIILSIIDEGVGVADDEKQKVFSRFYRVGNEETRNAKGSGLGLFIVQYIVKKHQAIITVKDNSPRGSIFQIEMNVA